MPPFPLFSVLLCVGEKYDRQEECIFAISFALRELLKLPQVVHFPPGAITSFSPVKKNTGNAKRHPRSKKMSRKSRRCFPLPAFGSCLPRRKVNKEGPPSLHIHFVALGKKGEEEEEEKTLQSGNSIFLLLFLHQQTTTTTLGLAHPPSFSSSPFFPPRSPLRGSRSAPPIS